MITFDYEVINLLGEVLGKFNTLEQAENFADSQINFCYIELGELYETN